MSNEARILLLLINDSQLVGYLNPMLTGYLRQVIVPIARAIIAGDYQVVTFQRSRAQRARFPFHVK